MEVIIWQAGLSVCEMKGCSPVLADQEKMRPPGLRRVP